MFDLLSLRLISSLYQVQTAVSQLSPRIAAAETEFFRRAKVSVGCFLLLNTGTKARESKNNMLTTVAWETPKGRYYALEGSVFVGAAQSGGCATALALSAILLKWKALPSPCRTTAAVPCACLVGY